MASPFFDRIKRMLHLPVNTIPSRIITLHVTQLDLREAELYRDPYLLLSRPLERSTLPCTCRVEPNTIVLDGHRIPIPPRLLDIFEDMHDGWQAKPFSYVLEIPLYLLPPA